MTVAPKLSICVPSRNRQYYLQRTVEGLCRSARVDVEFVIADNSDDAAIMNGWMAEAIGRDPRIKFLPSTDRTLSMKDNWERTMEAASGEWITFIGDDDHCDPDVIDLITRCEAELPDLDALGWANVAYTWPAEGQRQPDVNVPLDHAVRQVSRQWCIDRMFRWVDAGAVPAAGFSVYHAAVSRRLLETIRRDYAGTHFEHPTVDYDLAMKVIHAGRRFVYSARPFSIMGSCPKSNSYAVTRPDDAAAKTEIFNRESGRDINQDSEVSDFPFRTPLGITATIALCHQWFKTRYGFEVTGWEENFVRACARNTEIFADAGQFAQSRDGYLAVLRTWQGGRHLAHYQPQHKPATQRISATGFFNDTIYVDPRSAGIETAAEMFDLVRAITRPVADLEVDIANPAGMLFGEGEGLLRAG